MALEPGSALVGLDFVYDRETQPMILEVSYGFMKEGNGACESYWDRNLNWDAGPFDPYGCIVEEILKSVSAKQKN